MNGIGINIVAVSRLFVFVLLMFGMVCSHAQGLEPASEPCVIPSPHEEDVSTCSALISFKNQCFKGTLLT